MLKVLETITHTKTKLTNSIPNTKRHDFYTFQKDQRITPLKASSYTHQSLH